MPKITIELKSILEKLKNKEIIILKGGRAPYFRNEKNSRELSKELDIETIDPTDTKLLIFSILSKLNYDYETRLDTILNDIPYKGKIISKKRVVIVVSNDNETFELDLVQMDPDFNPDLINEIGIEIYPNIYVQKTEIACSDKFWAIVDSFINGKWNKENVFRHLFDFYSWIKIDEQFLPLVFKQMKKRMNYLILNSINLENNSTLSILLSKQDITLVEVFEKLMKKMFVSETKKFRGKIDEKRTIFNKEGLSKTEKKPAATSYYNKLYDFGEELKKWEKEN